MRIHDLIGKPYEAGGRGPNTYDCAGLVVEMQRRQGRMVVVPDTPASEVGQALSMRRILRESWRQLMWPDFGCVVWFKDEDHVGTMVTMHRFIHVSDDGCGVVLESLDSPRWKRKRHCFFEPC